MSAVTPNPFCIAASSQETNALFMESTFKIVDKAKEAPTKFNVETVFIFGRPSKLDLDQSYYMMITAAHVLQGYSH
jgi:hypothetical protein